MDCADHSDEINCGECGQNSMVSMKFNKKGKKNSSKNSFPEFPTLHCGQRRCMSAGHVCNGIMDCPWGQDERNCCKLHLFKVSFHTNIKLHLVHYVNLIPLKLDEIMFPLCIMQVKCEYPPVDKVILCQTLLLVLQPKYSNDNVNNLMIQIGEFYLHFAKTNFVKINVTIAFYVN